MLFRSKPGRIQSSESDPANPGNGANPGWGEESGDLTGEARNTRGVAWESGRFLPCVLGIGSRDAAAGGELHSLVRQAAVEGRQQGQHVAG